MWHENLGRKRKDLGRSLGDKPYTSGESFFLSEVEKYRAQTGRHVLDMTETIKVALRCGYVIPGPRFEG